MVRLALNRSIGVQMDQDRSIHSMVADLVAAPDRIERGVYRLIRTADQCLRHDVDLNESEIRRIEEIWKELFE